MNRVCWFGVMNFLMVYKWKFPQSRLHFQQLNSQLHFGKAQNPRFPCLLSWLQKWLWVDSRGDCRIKGRTLRKRNRRLLRTERTWVLACHIDPGQVQSSTRPMHDYSKCPVVSGDCSGESRLYQARFLLFLLLLACVGAGRTAKVGSVSTCTTHNTCRIRKDAISVRTEMVQI